MTKILYPIYILLISFSNNYASKPIEINDNPSGSNGIRKSGNSIHFSFIKKVNSSDSCHSDVFYADSVTHSLESNTSQECKDDFIFEQEIGNQALSSSPTQSQGLLKTIFIIFPKLRPIYEYFNSQDYSDSAETQIFYYNNLSDQMKERLKTINELYDLIKKNLRDESDPDLRVYAENLAIAAFPDKQDTYDVLDMIVLYRFLIGSPEVQKLMTNVLTELYSHRLPPGHQGEKMVAMYRCFGQSLCFQNLVLLHEKLILMKDEDEIVKFRETLKRREEEHQYKRDNFRKLSIETLEMQRSMIFDFCEERGHQKYVDIKRISSK